MKIEVFIGSAPALTEEQVTFCRDLFSRHLQRLKDGRKYGHFEEGKTVPILVMERLVDLLQDVDIVHPGWWPVEEPENKPGQEQLQWDIHRSKWQFTPITVNGLTFPPYYVMIFKRFFDDPRNYVDFKYEMGESIAKIIEEFSYK